MENTILSSILAVFSGIAEWFVEIIPIVISLFYAEGALTFMGYLAIIGLGISVIFLIGSVTRTSDSTRTTPLIARNSLADNLQPRHHLV